jgi:hypothetical protein
MFGRTSRKQHHQVGIKIDSDKVAENLKKNRRKIWTLIFSSISTL